MIPRAIFDADHLIFRETVRKVIARDIVPEHAGWESAGQIPPEAWRKAGAAGLLLCAVDETRGGGGGTFLHSAIVIEELARVGATGPCFALHSDVVAPYLTHFASDALRAHWLPMMADGRSPGAIAMTEPGAGSDLQAIRTRLRRQDGALRIDGNKCYISNARGAAFVIVACKDADHGGLTLVLVEKDRPGFRLGRRFDKIGCLAQDLSELFFDECEVPEANVIGVAGQGMAQVMRMLPQERLVQAVRAVAAAEAMFEWTIDHLQSREVFGKRLAAQQALAFKMAELHAEILAQRVLVDRCLELHLSDAMSAALAASVKMSSCEMQGHVADACLQMFGAAGFMRDTPIARAFVDARQARIAGGAVEIMKLIVSRELFGKRMERKTQ